MEKRIEEAVEEILSEFAGRDERLVEEVRARLVTTTLPPVVAEAARRLSFSEESAERAAKTVARGGAIPETEARLIAETIVRPQLRPVLKIRDNTLVMEFFAADSAIWRDRLTAAKAKLDAVIPAIGRIEVTGHSFGYDWLGTGWLIDNEVVVTNRHVAREFARRDSRRFVFRQGLSGLMTCRIDFLEELERARALEFGVSEVLWISPQSDADIAFLRVARRSNGNALSPSIRLSAAAPVTDQFVVTIGYPARDDEFPDQDLARLVFGDVYDKKRLAPGQILESPDGEVLHDCSTLGGNSGSVVLDLESGEAVALHYAGLFPTANYAVPIATVKDRLRRVLRGEFAPAIGGGVAANNFNKPKDSVTQQASALRNQTNIAPGATATFIIPLQVTVSLGAATLQIGGATVNIGADGGQNPSAVKPAPEDALETARRALGGNPNVAGVRLGYRFRNGWITDERVVVVEVKDKSGVSGKNQIPEQFGGVGVEIRSVPLLDKLRAEGFGGLPVEERVAKGSYRKPTHLRLREIRDEPLVATFHVSPDSGFPNLRDFFARTERKITATMYEFHARHILDALLAATRPRGRRLTMVTQRNGEMEESVGEIKTALGTRFGHVWASVGNAISADTNLLFPKAYHIKVAVRDGKEFWLSSGNWKSSGQPNIDPAGTDSTAWTPLRSKNREWHAVIENENLAGQFEGYIEYDFSESRRVPVPESLQSDFPDFFVPEIADEIQPEIPARYFDPLVVRRSLRIQPLLSPDNYIEHITGLVEEAERTIYVQNQSFNLLEVGDDGAPGDNERPFYELMELLRDRQETHDVKIIFRDLSQFGDDAWAGQQRLLDRLKNFGFDTERNVRIQKGCHTKGVIVDSDKVLLGSHNLTNQGALYNRDASLIIYDAEVARYFQTIFLFDWEHLARQRAGEEGLTGSAARPARPGEETPPGMRRVTIAELFAEFIE